MLLVRIFKHCSLFPLPLFPLFLSLFIESYDFFTGHEVSTSLICVEMYTRMCIFCQAMTWMKNCDTARHISPTCVCLIFIAFFFLPAKFYVCKALSHIWIPTKKNKIQRGNPQNFEWSIIIAFRVFSCSNLSGEHIRLVENRFLLQVLKQNKSGKTCFFHPPLSVYRWILFPVLAIARLFRFFSYRISNEPQRRAI